MQYTPTYRSLDYTYRCKVIESPLLTRAAGWSSSRLCDNRYDICEALFRAALPQFTAWHLARCRELRELTPPTAPEHAATRAQHGPGQASCHGAGAHRSAVKGKSPCAAHYTCLAGNSEGCATLAGGRAFYSVGRNEHREPPPPRVAKGSLRPAMAASLPPRALAARAVAARIDGRPT